MTDLDVVISKLESIQNTMDDHSATLKDLSKAFARMAVQQEQITGLQTQCNTLWRKIDEGFGDSGIITRVREFQQSCPREHFKSKFRDIYAMISFIIVCMGGLTGWIVMILNNRP